MRQLADAAAEATHAAATYFGEYYTQAFFNTSSAAGAGGKGKAKK